MLRLLFALCAVSVLAACSSGGSSRGAMSWSDLTRQPRPLPQTTVKWGEGETDIADVWRPEGEGPFPVVLMIHGGCWQKSVADRRLMNYAAEALREEGLAVWNVEYRGVDEEGGGYPGTFHDVRRAAAALAEWAPGLNLDASRVVAYGHSAGGHLALWLAASAKLPNDDFLHVGEDLPLLGVLSTGGLPDLEESAPATLPSCLASIQDRLTGADTGRAEPLADTSPDRLLPIATPQVSLNARHDRIAPPALGRAWTEEAEAAGDEARFVLVPGGHVELIAPGTPAFRETIGLLKAMLGEGEV
ncbi:alpha/beta hydrolase [Parvularcula dongshanensis]|uniref:Acetyl esterase/lipase n=1 Tax=Parvularcula dongshanensis TaxID=1173995 RepID=A0A840I3V3_9PROT|nr:alpha/beta hydrolase [Parvularcula dongshanensis]MBB4658720.1 acetyl esterase/lipase [Parvularcula dongshanensis]